MRFTKVLMSSAVVVAGFTGTTAFAAPADSGFAFSGAVDVSYDWAANDGVLLRQFDNENDGFVLHQVNLSATKAFSDGLGATVNVIMGEDANVVSTGGCDAGGEGCDDFDLTQAFVSKSWGNLSVMGGRYVTLAGMEVINPSGNINASRSLLFFFQPLVHTGARATYKINDMLGVSLGLANSAYGNTRLAGNSNIGDVRGVDNNTDQTVEAQIAFTPNKMLSVYLTGYSGNEDEGDRAFGEGDANLRVDTLDLVANINLTEQLYFGLNADYVNFEDDTGGSNEIHGVAGYAQFKFLPKWRVAVRSEYLSIDSGTGDGDTYIRENTLTIGHACSENFELMIEGRHDRVTGDSNPEVFFPIDQGPENDQYTATLKGVLKF